jgi:hypothetical protein
MSLRRAYLILLRLYPREHRSCFAAEMAAVFAEGAVDRRRQGRASMARFTLTEMTGLVAGAWRERIAKLAHSLCHTGSYIDGRGLPDRLLMRPAGVAWESYYGSQTAGALAQEATVIIGPCLNAYQRFAFGSTLRRLVILACGTCRCGQAPVG